MTRRTVFVCVYLCDGICLPPVGLLLVFFPLFYLLPSACSAQCEMIYATAVVQSSRLFLR